MVAFLAVEAESVPFKHANEALVGNRGMAAMPLFHAHRKAIDRHEFRSPPALAFRLVAGFLQNLIKGAEVCACSKKPAHGVADVSASFLVRRTAARKVQGWNVGNIGIAFLEDVRIEGRIP